MLSVLEMLNEDLAKVTDVQMSAAAGRLKQADTFNNSVQIVGQIHNEACRRLWVLVDIYLARQRRCDLELSDPERPLDEIERLETKRKSGLYKEMAKVGRAILWAQIAQDVGLDAPEGMCGHWTVKADWMLVAEPHTHKASPLLSGLFGGGGLADD